MTLRVVFAILVVAVPSVAGSSLRRAPAKVHASAAPAQAAPAKAVPSDAAQVAALRSKLQKIAEGFSHMLAPNGELSKTHIAGMMTKLNVELHRVLKETEKPQDVHKALKQLQDAQAGVQALSRDMTKQQTKLMAEGQEQEQSLLLGVLMRRQNEPRDKQMEVLTSAEFSKLEVVKAVLAAKNTKIPLFQQVAAYLDEHSPKPKVVESPRLEMPAKLKRGKDGKPDVTPIVAALEVRLHRMEENQNHMEQHHKEAMQQFDKVAEAKKNSTRAVQHHIQKLKHSEERQFAKESAMGRHDIAALQSAIVAVKTGDMAALTKAQHALNASMKAAQARSGKFLVLVQLVQSAQGLDCPYCAAQCVDKCHSSGNSYTTCMTECADAGK